MSETNPSVLHKIPKPVPSADRYLTLDVLRGLAAVAVFLFHCVIRNPGWQDNALRFGAAGVDLFFIISGFVIYHALSKNGSIRGFLLKRVARLYPAYWVAVTFTGSIILFQSRGHFPPEFLETYLGNLTMIQHMLGYPNLDEQYWTLEVELLFYVVIGIIVWMGQIRHTALIFSSALLIWIILLLSDLIPSAVGLSFGHLAHLPLFLTGILGHRILHKGIDANSVAYLIFAFAAALFLFDTGGRSQYYLIRWEYAGILALLTVLFLLSIFNRLTFLNTKIFLFLGRISYCFYLIHQYLSVRFLIPYMERSGVPEFIAIGFSFVTCCTVAQILYRFVEKPVTIYVSRMMAKNEISLH